MKGVLVAFTKKDIDFQISLKMFFSKNMETNYLIISIFILIGQKNVFQSLREFF
jgi:hypothetical protein